MKISPLAAWLPRGARGWLAALSLGAGASVALAAEDPQLREVCQLLSGDFHTAEQARENKDYLEIHLHVREIWKGRADGPWLYVEQAAATALDKPYRQRIYQLVKSAAGKIESRVFTLENPQSVAGAWRDPARFDTWTAAQLKLREGCSVFLVRAEDGSYRGATNGKGCASDLRGAAYATSEVTLNPTFFVSWDRGFDQDEKQVWGATAGGYIFRRADVGK